ncbi:MAG: hypothetical protein VW518_00165 [Burkholderiaceae bacterium]
MDYPLYTDQLDDSTGIKLKRALRKSPGGVLTNNVQVGEASALPNSIAKYRDTAADLYKQGLEMYNRKPDLEAIRSYAMQQGQQADHSMLNALAAQYAGERFDPFQAQMLKRSAKGREPVKVGDMGMMTTSGQFIADPTYDQGKRAEFLLQQAKAYETLAQNAQNTQDRLAAQAMQNSLMNQYRQDSLEVRRNNDRPSYSVSGVTPDGQQVVTNSRNGLSTIATPGPNGTVTHTPYTGSIVPKANYDKNVQAVQDALVNVERADALIKKVEDNPDAFGYLAGAISALPSAVQGRAGELMLDDETLGIRADILRQAAMEISDLYGAALSLGEQARADQFIVNKYDSPTVIIEKLRAARDYVAKSAQKFGPGALGTARQRLSNPAQSSTPPGNSSGGPLNADEQAELEALRRKHRGGQQ